MTPPGLLMFGNTPVPKTVSWTGEEGMFLAPCRYFNGRRAISQREAIGSGTPLFGKPHAVRQRRHIALGLCDLCGRPLKIATKVSLSHARPQPHGADGWAVLQVEPMLHVACAALSMRFCPSLKRDVREGTLAIRTVTRWRAQCALMDEVYTESMTGRACTALGHGKVELLQWRDRDLGWLMDRAGEAGLPQTGEGRSDAGTA